MRITSYRPAFVLYTAFCTLVFVFFLFNACSSYAQRAATTNGLWSALYGGAGSEEMEGVWHTLDGGFIVAGSTESYRDENGDAWLLKLNADGSIEWQKTYGGSRDEYIIDIKQTDDGGYIGAGWTESFGAGMMDFWVLKLDVSGNVLWEKTYGGADKEQAWSVEQTTDGGYIVAGGTRSFGAGGADYWVLKLDATGNVQWQKTFGGSKDDGGGDSYDEHVVRVLQDEDGNYVVAGNTYSFGAGEADIWVLKLDANGDILWQNAYGGIYDDSMYSIQEASDGGYLVPGVSESFSPDLSGDLWALKINKNGSIQWQKIYGLLNYWDEALCVGATSDGGCLIGGYYEEGTVDWDFFLLRLNKDGEALWQKRYEYGWDWPNAIQQVKDGGFIVAGAAWPSPSAELDLWVLRLAPDGTIGPTCNFIFDINLTQVNTNSTPITTNATMNDTSVTPQDSSAVVQDSPAVPKYLCQGQTTENCTNGIDDDGDELVDCADPDCAASPACQPPQPVVKVNGSVGPISISQGDNLIITCTLESGSHSGENADWWVWATSPFGTYQYTLNSGWQPSNTPIRVYGGPLFDLAPYTILDMSTLPVGNYTFSFSVDDNMDGVQDNTYENSVNVTIVLPLLINRGGSPSYFNY